MGGKKTVGVVHAEAFELLQRNYKQLWLLALTMFGVQMVLGIVMSVFTVPFQFTSVFLGPVFDSIARHGSVEDVLSVIIPLLGLFSVMSLLLMAVGVIVSIAQSAANIVAYDGTLQLINGQRPTADGLWKGFAKNWKRFFGVVAWSMLWQFLWGLLFLVPGIVKGYSYRMAPYLVLQYPEMTVRQALRKSMEMTNGYKGRLFGLDLILILYGIASVFGICVLFVGIYAAQILFLMPMTYAIYSIVYLDIKRAALDRGILAPSAAAQE